MAETDRCKHGLTGITCAYCQGYKPPKDKRPAINQNAVYMSEAQFNRSFNCYGQDGRNYYSEGWVENYG